MKTLAVLIASLSLTGCIATVGVVVPVAPVYVQPVYAAPVVVFPTPYYNRNYHHYHH